MSHKKPIKKVEKRQEQKQFEREPLKKVSGGHDPKQPAKHLYHSSTTARGK